MLRWARLLRTPVDELLVVGSRWSRLTANAVPTKEAARPSPQTNTPPTPFITIIPTLHVASMEFYNQALQYMMKSVKERKNVVILLEGVCDSEEGEVLQMQEYFEISRNEDLKAKMIKEADKNTLYDEETMRAICEELSVKYDVLKKSEATVRLQECYLKPKMASYVGDYLRNDADLNMTEVRSILLEEGGEYGSGSIPISQLGSYPAVRRRREHKVAKAARLRCVEWLHRKCEGEVIVPWGFYHTGGIKHSIMAMNAHSDSEEEENVVFVENNQALCTVSFGITKELLA